MKKLLLTATLSGALLLSACGNASIDSNKEGDDKSEQQETKKDNDQSAKKDNNNQQETNQNEQKSNQEQSDNQEQSNNKQQTSNNEPMSKEEITKIIRDGGNVDGMVDEDGDTWYQAPGGGDVNGYTKPDGTVCTVGGCTTPEEQEKANKDSKSGGGITITRDNVIDYVESYEDHNLDTGNYKFNEPEEKEDGTWGFAFYDKETGDLAGSYTINDSGKVVKYDEDGEIIE